LSAAPVASMSRNTLNFRVPFDPFTEVVGDHVPEEEILPWYPELTADRLGRLLGAMDNDVQIDRGNAGITYPMDQMVGPNFNDRSTAEDMGVNLMLNRATLSRAARNSGQLPILRTGRPGEDII
jgi:hypothetical protein